MTRGHAMQLSDTTNVTQVKANRKAKQAGVLFYVNPVGCRHTLSGHADMFPACGGTVFYLVCAS